MGRLDPALQPPTRYPIPLHHRLRIPLLFGVMSGRYWLPFSGGKLLRLVLGSYESEQTALIASQLRPGDVFYDVGAAVGYYTLLAAPIVGPGGCVIAFEPDAKNFAYLRQHVLVNQFKNVDVSQTAVGDRNGVAPFTCGTGTGTGRLDTTGKTTVPIRTLDGMPRHTPPPTHIKIDVEGAEMQVLAGARNILRTERPTLYLSTHGPAIHEECCRYLTELGYAIRRISSDPRCDSEILCIPARKADRRAA